MSGVTSASRVSSCAIVPRARRRRCRPMPRSSSLAPPRSAEGEAIGLDTGVEELDLEAAVVDRPALADELICPLRVDGAATGGVDVGAVRVKQRVAVEEDAIARGAPPFRRPHDEVH